MHDAGRSVRPCDNYVVEGLQGPVARLRAGVSMARFDRRGGGIRIRESRFTGFREFQVSRIRTGRESEIDTGRQH